MFVTNNGIGVLSVLDAATGAVVNSVPVSANTAAVDERAGRVFVASVAQLGTALGSDTLPSVEPPGAQHNAVFMLDARTGAILRTVHLRHKYAPGHLRALAVDERSGRVFVSKDGDVTMLDATRGTVLRAIDVGIAPAAMAVDEQTNHVWVTHWDSLGYYGAVQGVGSVSILNGTQGTVLKTLLVGVAPLVVAVDERQRRTFVLNGIYTRRSESSVTVLCET